MSLIPAQPTDGRQRPIWRIFAGWWKWLRADDRGIGSAVLVLGVWLLSLPILATAGSAVGAGQSADIVVQQRSRLPVTAQLIENAPDFTLTTDDNSDNARVPVHAKWITVEGAEHTGLITSAAGARLGDRMQVWADPSGNITDPPISTDAAATLVILGTAVVWLILGGLLLAMWQSARWRANRRRLANVDREWAQIEPVWSGRPA